MFGVLREISVSSPQFRCTSETTLKKKKVLKKILGDRMASDFYFLHVLLLPPK